MRTIASDNEKLALEYLEKMIISEEITPTDAWSCFSTPALTKNLSANASRKYTFTADQVAHFVSLKEKLKIFLEQRSSGRCEYCRRPKGQHGMSRHIEHVLGKALNSSLTFSIANLAIACLDCNYTKNNNIDRKKIAFDIINPCGNDFSYSDHLNFLQISTENFHLLKYDLISEPGRKTHERLNFRLLENIDTLTSISPLALDLVSRLETCISALDENDKKREVAKFLQGMKAKIFEIC